MGTLAKPSVSTARVERGLYALRYVESASRPCPVATVAALGGALEFLGAPGQPSGVLDRPGQVMIVRAEDDAAFELRVSPAADGAGAEASFKLELLDAGAEASAVELRPAPAPADRLRPAPALQAPEKLDLTVQAHVSRRGDVEAGGEAWVAGPDEILPIEGLAISTGRRDVTVALRVQTAKGGSEWSRWHTDGEFAGSRRRADPLVAIELALAGERASDYAIAAETMALGSRPEKKIGNSVSFVNLDAIVGFRMSVRRASADQTSPVVKPDPRVRVFRAQR